MNAFKIRKFVVQKVLRVNKFLTEQHFFILTLTFFHNLNFSKLLVPFGRIHDLYSAIRNPVMQTSWFCCQF